MNHRQTGIWVGIGFGLLILGATVTLGFMLHAGEPWELWWWGFFVPFAAWTLVPYAVLAFAVRRRDAGPAYAVTVCLGAALLAASSAAVLYSAFVAHLDPQSGLVLIFLPAWQLLGLMPILVVAQWLDGRAKAP